MGTKDSHKVLQQRHHQVKLSPEGEQQTTPLFLSSSSFYQLQTVCHEDIKQSMSDTITPHHLLGVFMEDNHLISCLYCMSTEEVTGQWF